MARRRSRTAAKTIVDAEKAWRDAILHAFKDGLPDDIWESADFLPDIMCETLNAFDEDQDGELDIVALVREVLESAPTIGSRIVDIEESVLHMLEHYNVLILWAYALKMKNREARAAAMLDEGKTCLAILSEDGEWHEATVVRQIRTNVIDDAEHAGTQFEVKFLTFGKQQVVSKDEIMPLVNSEDNESDDTYDGTCGLCSRAVPVTAHHLIPKSVHAKYLQKGFHRSVLATTAPLCRPCHSMVHTVADNATLAENYNTLPLLREIPEIQRCVSSAVP